ncbi:MAG: repeat protein [Pedosphaera sp.]|nr:repeat protein [Pedosphaera sp.]
MRKRSRIGFALLLLAVIGGIAWLAFRPNEPAYKGKRLSVWLEGYRVANVASSQDMKALHELDEVVRSSGTNAIPTLLRRLQAKDSSLTLWLVALAGKQHLFNVKFASAAEKQQEGTYGFMALGADGKAAVPELIKMYEQDSSPDSRSTVTLVLCFIGPAAEQAVPMLVRSLGDKTSGSWFEAALALGKIHARPEIAVPALVKCLNDQDFQVRLYAAKAIGAFGSDARLAVPDLLKLLADSNAKVQNAAKDALKRIDPEAAAEAGVK